MIATAISRQNSLGSAKTPVPIRRKMTTCRPQAACPRLLFRNAPLARQIDHVMKLQHRQGGDHRAKDRQPPEQNPQTFGRGHQADKEQVIQHDLGELDPVVASLGQLQIGQVGQEDARRSSTRSRP